MTRIVSYLRIRKRKKLPLFYVICLKIFYIVCVCIVDKNVQLVFASISIITKTIFPLKAEIFEIFQTRVIK